MQKIQKFYQIITISLLFFSIFSCKEKQIEKTTATPIIVKVDTLKVEKVLPIPIDTLSTELANLIGLVDLPKSKKVNINKSFWNKLKKETDKNFKKTFDNRLSKISEWEIQDFIGKNKDTLPLFYPFSGPDFLHVNYLYPNTKTYILSAIEKIGTLPNLLKKSTKSSQKYLTDINHFLRDIYLRGYFITNHMKSDLNDSSSDGVIGSLYWFIARTNHEIINYEFVTIDKLGNLIKENNPQEGWLKDNFDGIKFLLKDSNKIQKELIYLSADISNRGLKKKNPNLLVYFNKMGEVNTFVKSASYLMHYDSFTSIKNVVLEKSYSIFQDDTGIPYRFLKKDKYDVSLFGKYIKPIKDFESTMDIITQKDLMAAYKIKSINKGYLPFSLGYHWRNSKNQNQQLVVKKSIEP